MFHVYILYSSSLDRHYIGQTGNIEERLRFHRSHSTPFTAKADDWWLVYLEPVSTRTEAMAIELRIKRSKSRKAIARFIRDARNTVKDPYPISDGQ